MSRSRRDRFEDAAGERDDYGRRDTASRPFRDVAQGCDPAIAVWLCDAKALLRAQGPRRNEAIRAHIQLSLHAEWGRDPKVRTKRAGLHLAVGDRDGAIAELETFKRFVACDPGARIAVTWLGKLYEERGAMDRAESCYRSVLAAAPDDVVARNSLGNLYMKTRRARESEAQFAEILQRNPGDAMAHTSLGNLYAQTGRAREAEAQFAEVLQRNPGDAVALTLLGNLYAQTRPGVLRTRIACSVRLWKTIPTICVPCILRQRPFSSRGIARPALMRRVPSSRLGRTRPC